MGEVLEALKKNKYLDRNKRVFELSELLMFLHDDTLSRLAGTGKTHEVTTAALYHLSDVCYEIWGKRKIKEKNHE